VTDHWAHLPRPTCDGFCGAHAGRWLTLYLAMGRSLPAKFWRVTREGRRTSDATQARGRQAPTLPDRRAVIATRAGSSSGCAGRRRSDGASTQRGSRAAVAPCTWSIRSRCISTTGGRVQQPSHMPHSRVSAPARRVGSSGQPSRSIRSPCSEDFLLTERSDRIQALTEARRVLRSNGVVHY